MGTERRGKTQRGGGSFPNGEIGLFDPLPPLFRQPNALVFNGISGKRDRESKAGKHLVESPSKPCGKQARKHTKIDGKKLVRTST